MVPFIGFLGCQYAQSIILEEERVQSAGRSEMSEMLHVSKYKISKKNVHVRNLHNEERT